MIFSIECELVLEMRELNGATHAAENLSFIGRGVVHRHVTCKRKIMLKVLYFINCLLLILELLNTQLGDIVATSCALID